MEQDHCRLCGRPIEADAEAHSEGMHWICYHFAYEHDVDPDQPCLDATCPLRQLEIFRSRLIQLGDDPERLLIEYLDRRFRGGGD